MRFKYPKLAGVIAAIIFAYILFSNPSVREFISGLNSTGYFGAFIAGMFYTFGFTSPLSAGFFIDLSPPSILIAGILGGIGACIGDMFIFYFVKEFFKKEFVLLGNEKPVKSIAKLLDKLFGKRLNFYLMHLLAAFFIASPLPDEAGIILIAGFTKVKASSMAIIGVIFNTIGILILLSI